MLVKGLRSEGRAMVTAAGAWLLEGVEDLELFLGLVQFAGKSFEGKAGQLLSKGGWSVNSEDIRGVVVEETEVGALGLGLCPGGEGPAVTGGGKNCCAIYGNAVFGILKRAGKGDDKVVDGRNTVITVASALEGSGVVGDSKGMVRKGVHMAGDATGKIIGAFSYCRDEGGRPSMLRQCCVVGGSCVVDVGGEQVWDCGLCTCSEQGALGLTVQKAVRKLIQGVRVVGCCVIQEGLGECFVADWETKEADAGGYLRVGGVVVGEMVKGRLEMLGMFWGKVRDR